MFLGVVGNGLLLEIVEEIGSYLPNVNDLESMAVGQVLEAVG
jgi:hypothetical protein